MADCCDGPDPGSGERQGRQARVLKGVLWINALMFVVELVTGLAAGSVSLLGDSLDMFGDALAYGVSLYVVARSERAKARSALLKGSLMALFGLFVLVRAIDAVIDPQVPHFATIGIVGTVALAANGLCAYLLLRHRHDDINMHSVWLCARNDLLANLAVILAAGLVWWSGSAWPDILVGLGIALLFGRSAVQVLGHSLARLRATESY